MRTRAFIILLSALTTIAYSQSHDQNHGSRPKELVILAGLLQPAMLQGGNVEIDFYTKKMVFNYSHGFSLDLDSKHGTTVGAAKSQGLALHLPYSTGFGVGYRLSKFIDIRLEPKTHRFQIYYDGTDRHDAGNKVTDYRTITVGLGSYFRWKPFDKKQNALKGMFTSTSIRYWQNVWSSLENNQLTYMNRATNQIQTHKAANIGIANSPFLFNIAIGYSIQF